MARAFLFVIDSFGIGGARDAAAYGDEGANTYGNILKACGQGRADRDGLRTGPLEVPVMRSLGLDHCALLAGDAAQTPSGDLLPGSFHAAAEETSRGKDTPSGHWEIAGLPVAFDWGYFAHTQPSFPAALTAQIIEQASLPGILGDRHASGTEIIDELGEEHIRTGKPICYTSADSVYQIAAHETHFGLDRLYELCATVRRLVDPLNIGRVIARPFIGEHKGEFQRTANRRDYAVPPVEPTLLDRLVERGSKVIAIGKIGDIFAHRGISEVRKGATTDALFDKALSAMNDAADGDLVFANFVDFDTLYGHRRDIAGYAAALEAFDKRLPEALDRLAPGDLLILTADHGCDPSWRGTDHTRECVPVLGLSPGFAGGSAGLRPTFADIGETVADHLGLTPGKHGRSFLTTVSDRA